MRQEKVTKGEFFPSYKPDVFLFHILRNNFTNLITKIQYLGIFRFLHVLIVKVYCGPSTITWFDFASNHFGDRSSVLTWPWYQVEKSELIYFFCQFVQVLEIMQFVALDHPYLDMYLFFACTDSFISFRITILLPITLPCWSSIFIHNSLLSWYLNVHINQETKLYRQGYYGGHWFIVNI